MDIPMIGKVVADRRNWPPLARSPARRSLSLSLAANLRPAVRLLRPVLGGRKVMRVLPPL